MKPWMAFLWLRRKRSGCQVYNFTQPKQTIWPFGMKSFKSFLCQKNICMQAMPKVLLSHDPSQSGIREGHGLSIVGAASTKAAFGSILTQSMHQCSPTLHTRTWECHQPYIWQYIHIVVLQLTVCICSTNTIEGLYRRSYTNYGRHPHD